MVYRNSNKKSPFRDLAKSRRTILRNAGPFDTSHLKSRAGLFSTLVYRGITHNTQFLEDHVEVYFKNLQQFKERLKAYPRKEESFFCNTNAYGAWTDRTPDNAAVYWTLSGKPEFNEWLIRSKPTTFSALVNLIQKHAPAFGPLSSYLLAADYAIAQVVPMPSMEEMGRLIFAIDKGGKKGMKLLGFPVSSGEEVADGFVELDRRIRQSLGEDRLQKMGYNCFVLEHILCKHDRLHSHLVKSLAPVKSRKPVANTLDV